LARIESSRLGQELRVRMYRVVLRHRTCLASAFESPARCFMAYIFRCFLEALEYFEGRRAPL
jgi:hypothetical protein